MSKKKFLSLSLFTLPFFAFAQDTSKISTLAEVTVTAVRSEEQVLRTPRSVTVITSADIQRQPYQNLADLLQRYEGIFIPGTFQNPGSLQTVFLRGADNKQTLVMVDGVRLADASTADNGVDLSEVALNSVERIEIVRGSQGTLYGGSAVGGVINIVTKKNASTGTTGIAKVKAGTFGDGTLTTETQAGVTFTAKSGFYSRAEILNITSNGFNNAAPSPTGYSVGEEDNFRKTDYTAKVGLNNNKWDAYIGFRHGDQKADIDDRAFVDDDNNILRFKRNLLTYGLTRKINGNLSAKVFGGYTNTRRSNIDDSSIISKTPIVYDGEGVDNTYTGKNFVNEMQVNYDKNAFKLVGGVGYNYDKMNTSTSGFYKYQNQIFTYGSNYDTLALNMSTAFVYVHARYEVPLSEKYGLNLAGGVRYSKNNRFGSFFSYEFTPNLTIGKNIALYASLATGYNAPSLYQLFAPEKNFTTNITRGFKDLNAEESQSIELGSKAIISDNVGVRLSVYHNEAKNYIDYVYLWNGSKVINTVTGSDFRGDIYLNTGKQINEGVEVGIDIKFSDQWQIHGNMSYNSGKLEYNPSYINVDKTQGNHVQVYNNGAFLDRIQTTNDLARRPKFLSNTSVVFKPNAKWQLTADARTVGDRSDVAYNLNLGPFGALGREGTEDFALFNLSALWQPVTKVSISASVFNILNTAYVELNGFQTRRRSGFATIQYTF